MMDSSLFKRDFRRNTDTHWITGWTASSAEPSGFLHIIRRHGGSRQTYKTGIMWAGRSGVRVGVGTCCSISGLYRWR